jgi:hypothetical protein
MWWKYYVFMYVNIKMISVETIYRDEVCDYIRELWTRQVLL